MKHRSLFMVVSVCMIFFLPVVPAHSVGSNHDHDSRVTVKIISEERGELTKYLAEPPEKRLRKSYVIARKKIITLSRSATRPAQQ